jgi:hypothetical protein
MEMLKVSLIYLIGTGTEKNDIEGRTDEWTDQAQFLHTSKNFIRFPII